MLRFRVKTTLPFTWFPPFLFQSLLSLPPFVVVVVIFIFLFFVPYESPNSVPGKRGVIWGGNVCFLVCYHLFHFVLKWQGVELGRRLHLRSQKSQTVTRFWVYLFKVKKKSKLTGLTFLWSVWRCIREVSHYMNVSQQIWLNCGWG